jgi:hypothetical protein
MWMDAKIAIQTDVTYTTSTHAQNIRVMLTTSFWIQMAELFVALQLMIGEGRVPTIRFATTHHRPFCVQAPQTQDTYKGSPSLGFISAQLSPTKVVLGW